MEFRNPAPGRDPIDTRVLLRARSPLEVATEAVLTVPNTAKLLSRLASDARVPFRVKAFGAAVGVYVVSPIDIVPDLIPGIGSLDDMLLIALAADRIMSSVDEEVLESAWDGSEDGLDLMRAIVGWGADIVRFLFRWSPRP